MVDGSLVLSIVSWTVSSADTNVYRLYTSCKGPYDAFYAQGNVGVSCKSAADCVYVALFSLGMLVDRIALKMGQLLDVVAILQVLSQDAEFDALQWFESGKQHYIAERQKIEKAAQQATWASAERISIGQWLSGLVLGEGKVKAMQKL